MINGTEIAQNSLFRAYEKFSKAKIKIAPIFLKEHCKTKSNETLLITNFANIANNFEQKKGIPKKPN